MDYFNEHSVVPIKSGESGYAFIYDSNGIVIAHENPHNILDMNIKDFDYGAKMLQTYPREAYRLGMTMVQNMQPSAPSKRATGRSPSSRTKTIFWSRLFG